MRQTGWLVVAFALLAAVSALALPASASAQQTPVCSVCGQTFHENVTATDATLEVRTNGDVHWRVENEVTDSTAAAWRANTSVARQRAAAALDRRYGPLHDPEELAVAMEDETLVVEFVDRGAARDRFGVRVVPYLHGEGVQMRYVVNADEFVVEAPEGQRITNQPAGATVEGDRAVWNGSVASVDGTVRSAELPDPPEPGNTYVVVGTGATGAVGTALTLAFEPLLVRSYAFYGLGLLVVAGLTSAGYGLGRRTFDRRWLATAGTVAAVPYLAFALLWHPLPTPQSLQGFVQHGIVLGVAAALGIGAALALFAAAAIRSD